VAPSDQGPALYNIQIWIINKISQTILKSAFVAIAFIETGKFVVSVLAMQPLVLLMDFAPIAR
jgi:hypothetical protein